MVYLLLAILGGALVELGFADPDWRTFRLLTSTVAHVPVRQRLQHERQLSAVNLRRGPGLGVHLGVPLAFLAYLPATVLLDRTAELAINPVLA